MNAELFVRIITFVPLAFITFQVMMLRRILDSKAWTYIVVGFLTFVVLVGLGLVADVAIFVRLVISLIGYILVARGFHLLRCTLDRTTRSQRRTDDKRGTHLIERRRSFNEGTIMFSFWEMAKGRITAWLLAVIVGALASWQLSDEHIKLIQAFVDALVNLFPVLVYALGHLFHEKRKLDKGEVVPERVESKARLSR